MFMIYPKKKTSDQYELDVGNDIKLEVNQWSAFRKKEKKKGLIHKYIL